MRIGELSRETHVPVKTIRYYEEIGLLSAATRTDAGYRIFSTQHARELQFADDEGIADEAGEGDVSPCFSSRDGWSPAHRAG